MNDTPEPPAAKMQEAFIDFYKNVLYNVDTVKATPHDPRLTPLHIICLPAFRHITQILLDLRQQACVEFRQSDENLDGASDAQGSCGVALTELKGG